MVHRPLGHRLPGCPHVRAVFNHSSFRLQFQEGRTTMGETPHSMQISVMQEKMPHTEPVSGPDRTVPCVLGRKQKIRPTSPHYSRHRRSIDTSLFLGCFLGKRDEPVADLLLQKVKHYTQISKIITRN
ncbi:hypothetical protein ILYODFUR_002977 [Ilyodon furcidens]|uniref:Uncharacterized protein n=1 Tax=Ilyodon furcidens TaxID=33524 RepID=A0ABV0U421_9TELE